MWYVIQVPTGKEEQIKDVCLDRLDANIYNDIFILRYTRKMKMGGIWQERVNTLFPGYLFVDTDNITDVRLQLHNVQAMTIVLGSDGEPVPVSKEEREFLESLIDDSYIVRMSTGFIIGDEIVLTTGPLRSTKGVIKKINRHKKEAEIDVELFGASTKAVVGLEVIKKVTAEEFALIREEAASSAASGYAEDGPPEGRVKVLSGVFKGMTGRLLTPPEKVADAGMKELEIELIVFGAPSKVVVNKDSVLIG